MFIHAHLHALCRKLLTPFLSWPSLHTTQTGYSLFIGVPWDLKELLGVNLTFIKNTKTPNLNEILIVFDKKEKKESTQFIAQIRDQFPSLPLRFFFYPTLSGSIIELFNSSSWYNAMNEVIGILHCQSDYIIFHDFDLYPLHPDYFETLYTETRDQGLHIGGTEYSSFYGLKPEDKILGTWALCLDLKWLRNTFHPIDVFHVWQRHQHSYVLRDPTTAIQFQTSKRNKINAITRNDFSHANNLCSVYLQLKKKQIPSIAWRLHLLVYLYSLNQAELLDNMITQMKTTSSGKLCIMGETISFETTDPSCSNVLESEINKLEIALYKKKRPLITNYIHTTRTFLNRFGKKENQNKKKNIAQVIGAFNKGGAETLTLNLCKSLHSEARKSIAIALQEEKEIASTTFPCYGLNLQKKKYLSWFSACIRFRVLLKKNNIQIIHCHGPNTLLFTYVITQFLFKKPQLFFTWHDSSNVLPESSRLLHRLQLFVLSKTTALYGSSQQIVDILKSKLPQHPRLSVFPNAVPILKIPKRNNSCIKIAWMGRMVPEKDPLTLLSALKIIKKQKHRLQVLFIGGPGDHHPTYYQSILRTIKKWKLEDMVTLSGWSKTPLEHLKSCHIAVQTSTTEGLSLALLEQMMMGLAVIATPVGDTKKVIQNEKTGLLFEPKNHEQLAQKLEQLLTQEQLRQTLGTAARQHITAHFSLEKMATFADAEYR